MICEATISRARGVLFGQLAGDSLGGLVEFKDSFEIADLYPDGVRELKDGGTWNLLAGQPTDDSEMALALARSIAVAETYDLDQVAEAYIRWWRSEPFDIGHTTSTGIEALSNGKRSRSDSQANGALMRICPVGILAAGDPALAAKLASIDASLTHPDPVCRSANAAFSAAIAAGIAGADADTMWQAAYDHADKAAKTIPGASPVRQRLEAARSEPPPYFHHKMGWVLTAFQNAFFHLVSERPFEEAVVWTVGSGGDTDTNAAICGALLGAAQGKSAIPDRWTKVIENCRPLEESGAQHPRPAEYWPNDASDLADRLLSLSALGEQDQVRG